MIARPLAQGASALWERVGPRGLALLFFANTDLIYGWSLLSPSAQASRSPGFDWVASVMPLKYWGILWMAVGAILLVGVFLRDDSVAWASAVLLKVLWGGLWLAGWLVGAVDRGYASAAIWLPAAGLVAVLAVWLPGSERRSSWIQRPRRR